MTNVLVRDLPESVHRLLVKRAAAQRESLQAYLRRELEHLAERAAAEEILERAGRESEGTFGLTDAVAALDDARAGR